MLVLNPPGSPAPGAPGPPAAAVLATVSLQFGHAAATPANVIAIRQARIAVVVARFIVVPRRPVIIPETASASRRSARPSPKRTARSGTCPARPAGAP